MCRYASDLAQFTIVANEHNEQGMCSMKRKEVKRYAGTPGSYKKLKALCDP